MFSINMLLKFIGDVFSTRTSKHGTHEKVFKNFMLFIMGLMMAATMAFCLFYMVLFTQFMRIFS